MSGNLAAAYTAADEVAAWQGAGEVVPSDQTTQALIGGVNLRVDVLKAFRAVYISAKVVLSTKKIVLTGVTHPAELLGLAKDVFDAVVTTLDALRERMTALTYTACAILAQHPQGLSPEDLEKAIRDFLGGVSAADMPWYLGLTKDHAANALEELSRSKAFDDLMARLVDDDWIDRVDGRLRFRPRHYTWGAKLG
jgi:hypothetical protein